ncbi:MAG: hypothetical protein PHN45_03490 [Methylococcales bacterium]|nr:hypothetical protein [Methylococcales bacterium]MDD5753797.1 hypothetical protein [Methylococcales bacterium]
MKTSDLVAQSLPWLTGSGVALSQGLLATACTVPKIGTCAGCGSCIIAVATFTGLALKKRREQRKQGLEPFEIRTKDD